MNNENQISYLMNQFSSMFNPKGNKWRPTPIFILNMNKMKGKLSSIFSWIRKIYSIWQNRLTKEWYLMRTIVKDIRIVFWSTKFKHPIPNWKEIFEYIFCIIKASHSILNLSNPVAEVKNNHSCLKFILKWKFITKIKKNGKQNGWMLRRGSKFRVLSICFNYVLQMYRRPSNSICSWKYISTNIQSCVEIIWEFKMKAILAMLILPCKSCFILCLSGNSS